MPKLKYCYPKMCRDRNQAFSWYKGKRVYHGVWGSPEAKESYKRFISALMENPDLPVWDEKKSGDALVSELAIAFLKHAESRKMDKVDVAHFKRVVGFLVEIFGGLAVNEFSPKKLKVCRTQMVNAGTLCRRMVNDYTRKIVRIFGWGVEEELAPETTWRALKAVQSLKKGEQGVRDNPPRQEVSDDVIKRTLPFMSPTVAAMVKLQRLTGMRPSEVYRMTVGAIDQKRDPELWYYIPAHHKTERFIGEKPIPLGKPEQALIGPYLAGKAATESVFSPRQAVREKRERQRAERKTKISPSQQERNRQRAKNPAEKIGDFYDKHSYRKAIEHAIQKGNKILPNEEKIPNWTPYQLRHTAGTATEKAEGLDKAQALLGHTSADMTKRYTHNQLVMTEEMARKRVNPFEDKPVETEKD